MVVNGMTGRNTTESCLTRPPEQPLSALSDSGGPHILTICTYIFFCNYKKTTIYCNIVSVDVNTVDFL